MAEVTNHILFAKKIMKKINNSNKNLYLYSVGPDSFYFGKDTYNFAKIMHKSNSRLFFENYIKYIKDNNLKNNLDVISSLYGFITHYVLDYTIHPYVFYKGGIFNRNDINTLKYLDGHRSIEMGITSYYYGKNINNFKMYEYMNIKNNNYIKSTLDYVLKQTYNIDNGYNKYLKSYNQMRLTYKYFRFDKYGIKKAIYKFTDLFRKNKSKLSYISFHNINNVDLNINHNKWINPCDKNISYFTSVDDLFNKSEMETLRLIKISKDLLFDKIDINEFRNKFPNLSYLSAQECDSKKYLRYFE